jgi:hypothetical protein
MNLNKILHLKTTMDYIIIMYIIKLEEISFIGIHIIPVLHLMKKDNDWVQQRILDDL